MLITARYTEAAQPLTDEDLTTLGTYNVERSRGIVHRPEWNRRMELLQAQFDAHQRWRMQQTHTELAPGLWAPRALGRAPILQRSWFSRNRLSIGIVLFLPVAIVIWLLLIEVAL